VFYNVDRFRADSSFCTWIVRIARNEALMKIRRRRLEFVSIDDDDLQGARGAKVFATVSADKRSIVEALGATAIDRNTPIEEHVARCTGGEGFDVVYGTLGGEDLGFSFVAVKRYTGHLVSCLGWGTHALAPLSFRAGTYSGVFTLFPLLSGTRRAHHGEILQHAAQLAEKRQLKPLMADRTFGPPDLAEAFDAVAKGSKGKVVVEL
jgi:NADPH2:quinone reductase